MADMRRFGNRGPDEYIRRKKEDLRIGEKVRMRGKRKMRRRSVLRSRLSPKF